MAGSVGQIDAATLTGSSKGDATFTGPHGNGTRKGLANTSGDFSLNDTTPLTITGALNATGHTVTLVNSGGGIDASNGVIDAATLTGSTTGDALFTDSANAINTLNGFTNTSGDFSLTDNAPLTVTGTLDVSGHTLTLIDTDGGIDQPAGAIIAATLTGSTTGTADLGNAVANQIGTLAGFTNTSGSFELGDLTSLTITGRLNATGQTVTLIDG